MALIENTSLKLQSILETVEALGSQDLVFESGVAAVKALSGIFGVLKTKLDKARRIGDMESAAAIADTVNAKIFFFLPIIGFIQRSTHVRNAFEILDPLQHLASSVLQGRSYVIVSSEWEYMPFAVPQSLPELDSFALIGLPASEAGNSMLLPLAGHELGHAVWRNRDLEGSVATTLQFLVDNEYRANIAEFSSVSQYDPQDIMKREFLGESIGRSVDYGVRQAEEIFCDVFAYAIFGSSYISAFAYVLAPGSGQRRSPYYPSIKARMEAVARVAKEDGTNLPTMAELGLREELPPSNTQLRFELKMVEPHVLSLVPSLLKSVSAILAGGNVPRPNSQATNDCYNSLSNGVPPVRPNALGDIMNAAWRTHDAIISKNTEFSEKLVELRGLNELVLKSLELLEYYRKVQK